MTDRKLFTKAVLAPPTRREELFDWLLAVGLTAFVFLQMAIPRFLVLRGVPMPRTPFTGPHGGGVLIGMVQPTFEIFVLGALCILPLGLRRRFPLSVLAFITAATVVFTLSEHPPVLITLGMLVAIYTAGVFYDRGTLVAATAVALLALLLVALPPLDSERWFAEFVGTVGVIGVAAALGDATRNRRAYIAEVEQRALEAERTRDEEARRRVDEERLRIARELHDVTAHSLSVIAVQSGAAAHVLDTKPEESRRALEAIRKTSRDALTELRRMVGVLRGEEEGVAPHEPMSTLAQLPGLVGQFSDAGMDVRLDVPADLSSVPTLVDSSAYRVIQESLTNALRHAGPGATASVNVFVWADAVDVVVTDTGQGSAADWAEGHGLAGMRERAVALGGTFDAGAGADGGFRVAVRYPLAAPGGNA
jgi:signal transduction histidine kinase